MNEEKWIKIINQVNMDQAMKQRLYEKGIEKKDEKYMKLRYFKLTIICAGIIAMLVAVPIIGRMTSNVLVRMQEMDRKEVEDLNTMIQEQPPTVEADSFSRMLTEEEQSRKEVLLEEYTYKARFPQNEVSMMQEELPQPLDKIYYDMQNSKFYLPNRQLTDEELLQIIDFNHKRDYSLQVVNKVEKPEVNMIDINNMEIEEKAEYIIENIYDVDAKSLERTVEWYNEDEDAYEITFVQGNREFYICMGKETLNVENVSVNSRKDFNSYQVVTKDIAENATSLFDKSKDIIENVFGIEQQIKNAWCNYYIGDGNRGQDRNLNYLFELEDGSAYIFNYVYEKSGNQDAILLTSYYVGNFEWYHKILKDNESNNVKKGIERVEFKMNLEE